jgi:nucleotide-binding universal stress UspA family protein
MKILFAIDDSKYSQASLQMVTSQNHPRKTTVRVLHVVEPMNVAYYPELIPPYPMDFSDIQKKKVEAGRKLLERMTNKLRAAGFKVESSVRTGHVRTTIVDVAKKWHANLIVVGSHGRTGLAKLMLGSVSEYVARHATCSVQIVRTQKR